MSVVFLELIDVDGHPFLINVDTVSELAPDQEGAIILTTIGHRVRVGLSYPNVVRDIQRTRNVYLHHQEKEAPNDL